MTLGCIGILHSMHVHTWEPIRNIDDLLYQAAINSRPTARVCTRRKMDTFGVKYTHMRMSIYISIYLRGVSDIVSIHLRSTTEMFSVCITDASIITRLHVDYQSDIFA